MNSAPPSILSTSSLLADSAKRSMRVWVGIARHLFDTEVGLRGARDLRKVGDREHLRPFGEPAEGLRDRMRRAPADAGVDLVEDDRRLTGARMGDRAQGKGDA